MGLSGPQQIISPEGGGYSAPNATKKYSHPNAGASAKAAQVPPQKVSAGPIPRPGTTDEGGWGTLPQSSFQNDFKEGPSVDAQSDQKIAHMDSVLTDHFNVIKYGQAEVDKAKADSANIAQNVEALKGGPATGSDKIQPTTPQERMNKRIAPSGESGGK